jgi:hypothetical protein
MNFLCSFNSILIYGKEMLLMSKKEIKCEVIEEITTLKEYNGDYKKKLMRVIWNDNPITMDIRQVNTASNFVGKGISLTDEECETLTNALINEGYGSVENMKKAIVRNMSRVDPDIKSYDDCEECSSYYIDEDGYEVVEIPKYE